MAGFEPATKLTATGHYSQLRYSDLRLSHSRTSIRQKEFGCEPKKYGYVNAIHGQRICMRFLRGQAPSVLAIATCASDTVSTTPITFIG